MGETILAAMVTGVVTLAVCLVNNYFQQSKTRALLEYKLNDLTERVNKHNDLIERTYRLEEQLSVTNEKVNDKIADLNASGTNKYGATTTNKYSSYLNGGSSGSSGGGSMPSQYTGSSQSVNTYDSEQAAIKAKMNANSIAWYSADEAEKARLHAENQALASMLGGSVGYDSKTGYWSGDAFLEEEIPLAENPSWSYGVEAPSYSSSYSSQIDALLNQILNRDKFSYDAEQDDLYQQYKKMYNREGARAMDDTLDAAAAQAGGMNSYAVTAANQANNYYAAQVADKIPELYQLAYDMYLTDIDNQVRDLGLLQSMDDTQYNRYRDTMSDWKDDRDFAYGVYRDDVGDKQWQKSFDYDAYRDLVGDLRDDKEWAYYVKQDERDYNYQLDKDKYNDAVYDSETAYNRAMDMLSQGVMPSDDILSMAGLTKAEALALQAANVRTVSYGGSSGGGNSKRNSSDGSSGSSGYTGSSGNSGGSDSSGGVTSKDWNAALSLGAGPLSASAISELAKYGAIKESNGKFTWSNGWNASNYSKKLKELKSNFGFLGN